ncbi:MAG: hypothetical protein ACLQVF_17950, partial [Isosphaeraceae bacterium]
SSPTDTQQALYSLPQRDYNVIASGTNGYSAAEAYNLVTGLGTPVANLLVSDLVAYQGPGTSYAGPTVAPMQSAALINTEAIAGGPIDVFSIFDSITLTSSGAAPAWARGASSTYRAGQAAGASSSSASGQYPNNASFAEGTRLLASPGPRPAAPLIFVPAAEEPGLASLDLALTDETTPFDTVTSTTNPVLRIRLNRAAAPKNGKNSRSTQAPPVPAVDAAALDALLRAGWRARSSWVADRPRPSIKGLKQGRN